MFELKKFLNSAGGFNRVQQDVDSTFPGTGMDDDGLETEYKAIVERQFKRLGIDQDCVAIEIRKQGEAEDGLGIFVAMVQLTGWDRVSVLRILLGLPMLETKLRQAAGATWLADVSHFGGVWLNSAPELRKCNGAGELRELLIQLTPLGNPSRPGYESRDHDDSPTTQPQLRAASLIRS